MRVETNLGGSWEGISCESDAWPYSPNSAVFEARRAVGQVAKGFGRPPGNYTPDPVLVHLIAARLLESALDDVRRDLVAEARARGTTWATIAVGLSSTTTASQKRFGEGVPDGHLGLLREELMVTELAAQVATTPQDLPDELADDLAGTTPVERIDYAFNHIMETLHRQIDEQLESTEPGVSGQVRDRLNATHSRLARVTRMLTADHAQWAAVASWPGQAGCLDQVNYFAPATYLLYAMRLLLHASLLHTQALDEDIDVSRQFLMRAEQMLAGVTFILERDDVRSVLAPRRTEQDIDEG